MRAIRRLFGLVFGIAGLAGLLLSLAGIVTCWIIRSEVNERVDRAFNRADDSLAEVSENLRQADVRLRQTQSELVALHEREANRPSKPAGERDARRALSRKSLEAIPSQLGSARTMLIKASEIGLVANGLMDALAELSFVERSSIDTERLKSTSDQLSQLNERTAKLANLLSKPDADTEIDNESSGAGEVLDRIIMIVEEGSKRTDAVRGKIADGHTRIRYWLNAAALTITIVLFWIGLGQLSLLIHGRNLIVRRDAKQCSVA